MAKKSNKMQKKGIMLPSNILLPPDPNAHQPITMEDPIEKGLTPKSKVAKALAERLDEPGNYKYAMSTVAHAPDAWMKMGQASGVNTVMTNPMWFSPLHTPQSWQIASKRREIYQWQVLIGQVLTSNFTYIDIDKFQFEYEEKIEDTLTGGFLFNNIKCEKILDGTGSFRRPLRFSIRDNIDVLAFEFNALGYWRKLTVSENHPMIILNGQLYRKKLKLLKGAESRARKGIPANREKRINIQNSLVEHKLAQNVRADDYLLAPIPECGTLNIEPNKAWMIGQLSADGHLVESVSEVGFTTGKNEKHIKELKSILGNYSNHTVSCEMHTNSDEAVRINTRDDKTYEMFDCYIEGKKTNKKFTSKVFELDRESRLYVLGGYFDGDGCFNGDGDLKLVANNYSKDMADQIYWLLLSVGIKASLGKYWVDPECHYKTDSEWYYRIFIPSSDAKKLQPYMRSNKIPNDFVPKKERNLRFFYKEDGKQYFAQPIKEIKQFLYNGPGYDLEIKPEHTFVASGFVTSNCRFFFSNEPKVFAAINFYSLFPMSAFKLECKNKKIMNFYYEKVVKKLKLAETLKQISTEYFMLGDVFIHFEIKCDHCKGSGIDPETNEQCNHPDGIFKRMIILNPDWIEVRGTPLAEEPVIMMVADEELKKIVQQKQPRAIYDALPDRLKKMVLTNQPIPLSNRTVSHLKHMPVPYGMYGTSLIRCMFTTLAYKTKIMTANWIVAERLILPIRSVKVGSDNRPASSADLADMQQQLSAVANDPNLTIITHHNVEYEWVGACHDEETEVLTNNGWKYLKDISNKEIVATYNSGSQVLEFQQIQKKHEYEFNSNDKLKMINFKHRSVDIMVTPNHRMLIERNKKTIIVEAKNVKHNDKFISTAKWKGAIPRDLPYRNSPLGHLTLDEYLEFVGYYISEGGSKRELSRGLSEDKQIQASGISQRIDSFCYGNIARLSKKVYSNCYVHVDHREAVPTHTFMISNVEIARYLSREFGENTYNKKIPGWIKNLPSSKLSIIYSALISGDGDVRHDNTKPRYRYSTTSCTLANDVSEICLKLGYWPNVQTEKRRHENHEDIYRICSSENRVDNKFTIRNRNIHHVDYSGKVYCVTVPNGFFFTRRNGKITVQGNSGKILQVTQEMENIGKEILDGFMLNQALLNGEMSGYQSAQVGVEVLIRRLEAWRNKLSEWVEETIFKPIAEMQGFVDEEASAELGETVYLYPTIKWDDLHLKDKSQWHQILMQLHDKGVISTQTLCEELDLKYDQEIERLRYEQAQGGPAGGMLGGQGGGMGGMPGGMGGGMPGGDMGAGGGGMPGGDMGAGGMGGAGGGGMPGGGMGGAGGAASPMAGAGGAMKVTKKGKQNDKSKELEERAAQQNYGFIKLTSIEQSVAKMMEKVANIVGMRTDAIRIQFPFPNPRGNKPFTMDFAIPHLKLCVESDGSEFHTKPDQIEHDKERDKLLAQRGWTVLRFKDKVINEAPQRVEQEITHYVKELSKKQEGGKKTAEKDSGSIHLYDKVGDDFADIGHDYDYYFPILCSIEVK